MSFTSGSVCSVPSGHSSLSPRPPLTSLSSVVQVPFTRSSFTSPFTHSLHSDEVNEVTSEPRKSESERWERHEMDEETAHQKIECLLVSFPSVGGSVRIPAHAVHAHPLLTLPSSSLIS